MNNNYFCVNRGLLNSDRWLSEPFTRGQAWVDLFGLAQFTEGFFRIRGIKVAVQRGQLAYSQLTLASRWHWSRDKVRRYLVELEKYGDIIQQNNEVTTLITIIKYDQWQLPNTTNDTTNKQQKNNRKTTNDTHNNKDNNIKNDNNVNNVNKFSPAHEAENFFLSVFQKNEQYTELAKKLESANLPFEKVSAELDRFASYWTELTKDGKKQRWQLEKTFEIKKRITTWFSRINTGFSSRPPMRQQGIRVIS